MGASGGLRRAQGSRVAAGEPLLQVASLEVVYHSVVLVLKGVSITIPKGAIVALLGPNGAGKTTLLRAITGLLGVHDGAVTKGSIRYAGEDITALAPEAVVRRGIAQAMEGRRILADLTVEDNLLAGGYTAPRASVKTNLERSYQRFPILHERRHQPAGYLSGGEQQMLAIARAMMASSELLVLDEPSLGLAPSIVRDLGGLIRQINDDGLSVLLVEQNANMALQLAHHGYVLENGKVVMEGSAQQLRSDADIREFYLGTGHEGQRGFRDVKLYRRRKRWLS